MTPKEQFFAAVRAADIAKQDWLNRLLPIIMAHPYARGYIACYESELGEKLSCTARAYRNAILELEDYDIWDQP